MKTKKIKKILKKNNIKLNNFLKNPEYNNVEYFLIKEIKEEQYIIEAHNFDSKIQKYPLVKDFIKSLDLKNNKKHLFLIKKETKKELKPERIMKLAFYKELRENYPEGSIISEYTHTELKSRADFAVFVNGECHVFELKSEQDNLYKLTEQVKEYKKYANKIIIVIHEKHFNNYEKLNLTGVNLIIQTRENQFIVNKLNEYNEVKENIFNLVWYKEKEHLFSYLKGNSELSLTKKVKILEKSRINLNQLTNLIIEERYKNYSNDSRLNYLNIFKERKFEPCKKNLKYFYKDIKDNFLLK